MFGRFLIFALNQLRTLLITVQRYAILRVVQRKSAIKTQFCVLKVLTTVFMTSEELKQWRKSLNVTQKEFAVLVGQGERTVQVWESGQGIPEEKADYLRVLVERNYAKLRVKKDAVPSIPHQKVETTDKHGSTSQVDAGEVVRVPLIPFEAQGGQLDGFARDGVTLAQCETVPTPFKGAQFAISVRGQSMSPAYPSGCVLFISKNIADWVEWGKVYVLDTENGVIVKQLAPSSLGNDFVCCKSFNDAPEFAPFDVPKSTIFGIYRVVGALIET